MKKLFISVPMKGRTDEAIKASMEKMHKSAEAIMGEELEVIDSYISTSAPRDANEAVWYLGKSIQYLSEADVMVRVECTMAYSGCEIERRTALEYGIPTIPLPTKYVAPDVHTSLDLEPF